MTDIAPPNQPTNHKNDTKRHKRRGVLASCAVVVIIGSALTLFGLVGTHPSTSAPLPAHPFSNTNQQSNAIARADEDAEGDGDKRATGASPSRAESSTSSVSIPELTVPKLSPNELDIPSLGVLAPLQSETIANSSLNIPSDVHTVGIWADGGQVVDTKGTVLLAGHINYFNQGNGALYDLSTISPNAEIFVSSPTGKVTEWLADSLAAFPKANLPQNIFDPTGPRHLVIVTCGGAFNSATGHYVDNVVVTANPISDDSLHGSSA
jgi:hypothetical protein